jgi:hypothetical protein
VLQVDDFFEMLHLHGIVRRHSWMGREIADAALNGFGHAKEDRRGIKQHAETHFEKFFWRKPWSFSTPFKDADGQRHSLEIASDLLQLFLRFWSLELDAIGSGFQIEFRAFLGIVQAVGFDRVGAGEDEKLGLQAGGDGRFDFVCHILCLDHFFAAHMAALFGSDLIFNEQRGSAHQFVFLNCSGHVFGVTVAIVTIDQHGQRRSIDDFFDHGAFLSEMFQVEVRDGMHGACEGETTNLVSLEAAALDNGRRGLRAKSAEHDLSGPVSRLAGLR